MNTARLLSPLLFTLGGACLCALFGTLQGAYRKWLAVAASIVTLLLTAAAIVAYSGSTVAVFGGMLSMDFMTFFFWMLLTATVGATVAVSFGYLDGENLQHPEYYALLMFSAFGMMVLSAATDFLVLFLAVELMSIPVYVLSGFRRSDRRGNEAAIKYLLLGGVSSAILLYGIAMVYGVTGTTGFSGLGGSFSGSSPVNPVLLLGLGLLGAGLMFKVAAVPFHMWLPDVYEGAPTPISGFMAAGIKAAAFAALIRLFIALGDVKVLSDVVRANLHATITMVAILTMVIGNLIALRQTNLKRMLAFSSIAHAGYVLVGFVAAGREGSAVSSILVYLVAYALMNLGAFAVLAAAAVKGDLGLNLYDFSGLASRRPGLALVMTVFLLSLAGVPTTAGFMGKFLLFYSAVQAGETWLVIIAVLCSAISVYYYLRVVVYMYMRKSEVTLPKVSASVSLWLVLGLLVLLTMEIGIYPAWLLSLAEKAVAGL